MLTAPSGDTQKENHRGQVPVFVWFLIKIAASPNSLHLICLVCFLRYSYVHYPINVEVQRIAWLFLKATHQYRCNAILSTGRLLSNNNHNNNNSNNNRKQPDHVVSWSTSWMVGIYFILFFLNHNIYAKWIILYKFINPWKSRPNLLLWLLSQWLNSICCPISWHTGCSRYHDRDALALSFSLGGSRHHAAWSQMFMWHRARRLWRAGSGAEVRADILYQSLLLFGIVPNHRALSGFNGATDKQPPLKMAGVCFN